MRLAAILMAVLFAAACQNAPREPAAVSAGLQEKIIGQWTDGASDNAIFDISKDSIHYVAEMNHRAYQLLPGDSISIQLPFYTYMGKISFSGDTLLIADGNGVKRFWRFK